MSPRRALALLALLVLPACFDPLVGTECATGYAPCHGTCVATGTCDTPDAPSGATSEAGAGIETATVSTDVDDSETGQVIDAGIDVGEPEASVDAAVPADGVDEASNLADTAKLADVPLHDDAPAKDDSGSGPLFTIDAAVDEGEAIDSEASESGSPCLDCVDAEGIEVGTAEDSGAAIDDANVAEDATENATEDATLDDADNSTTPDGPLVCTESLLLCNDQCVDTSLDPENCGDCNNICASGVCIDGGCLVCAAEESVCGRQCLNLANDPDNCGSCGNPCGSGLCSNGVCEAAGTGRAIVIGHDYLRNRPAMNRILGNAVFLWPVNPVRLLVYEGSANAAAIAGADTAIAQVSNATGRHAVRTAASAAEVPALLATTDVFLIYGQELADDATLGQLGSDWSAALLSFMSAGGTVVLLDAVYAGNNGTCQILAQPSLFQLTRAASSTGDVCTVVARGDALTTGLPRTYLCDRNSTSFVVTDLSTNITVVVQDVDKTVVAHKLF